jgi:hypothetical protein
LRLQLESGSSQNEGLVKHAGLLEGRAETAEQHAIELAHCIAPLLDEVDQLRRQLRSLLAAREIEAGERAKLEAQIRASAGARFRALWRRFGMRWELPFRAGRLRP